MTTATGQAKIFQALIDPRWSWGPVNFDGANHISLTLYHPEHGTITSL